MEQGRILKCIKKNCTNSLKTTRTHYSYPQTTWIPLEPIPARKREKEKLPILHTTWRDKLKKKIARVCEPLEPIPTHEQQETTVRDNSRLFETPLSPTIITSPDLFRSDKRLTLSRGAGRGGKTARKASLVAKREEWRGEERREEHNRYTCPGGSALRHVIHGGPDTFFTPETALLEFLMGRVEGQGGRPTVQERTSGKETVSNAAKE